LRGDRGIEVEGGGQGPGAGDVGIDKVHDVPTF
jgi:hypothetical protein